MKGTLNNGGNVTLDWLTFVDPENDDTLVRVNATYMTSSYACMFGNGCPGLLNRRVQPDIGCCERGVAFADDEDREQVEAAVKLLTAEDADYIDHIQNVGWAQRRKSDGKPMRTRKIGDACIFANREGGATGKPGCAFHHLSERIGVPYTKLKPNACFTQPVAFKRYYEGDYVVLEVTAWDADEWGGYSDEEAQEWENEVAAEEKREPVEARGHMGFWCIDTPDAYEFGKSVGAPPLYMRLKDEFTEIIGAAAYDKMCELFAERNWDKTRPPSRMPGEVRNEGRPMIPLLIADREDFFANGGRS